MADETTDISSKEQFSVCIRVVVNMRPVELFMGLYDLPDTTSETLYAVLKDVLMRLGLSLEKIRGHCFDGASNMS